MWLYFGLDDQVAVTSTTSYAYNLQGRMSRVELDIDGDAAVDTIIETTYNNQGIRVRETTTDVDTSTTTVREYVIDARNHTGCAQVLEEIVDGALAKAYTIGLDVIAQVGAGAQGAVPAGTPLVLLYDGHGSTRALLDDGVLPGVLPGVIQRFAYDAYGIVLTGAQLTAAANAFTSLLYSGEAFNPMLGLQYLRARYYDPATGRFNRLDPFAGNQNDPQSLHKYAYVHGDPVNGWDPSGYSIAPKTPPADDAQRRGYLAHGVFYALCMMKGGFGNTKVERIMAALYDADWLHAMLWSVAPDAYFEQSHPLAGFYELKSIKARNNPGAMYANERMTTYDMVFSTLGLAGRGDAILLLGAPRIEFGYFVDPVTNSVFKVVFYSASQTLRTPDNSTHNLDGLVYYDLREVDIDPGPPSLVLHRSDEPDWIRDNVFHSLTVAPVQLGLASRKAQTLIQAGAVSAGIMLAVATVLKLYAMRGLPA